METEDYEVFKKDVCPFIRTGFALLLYLVKKWTIQDCYVTADEFITELKRNLTCR